VAPLIGRSRYATDDHASGAAEIAFMTDGAYRGLGHPLLDPETSHDGRARGWNLALRWRGAKPANAYRLPISFGIGAAIVLKGQLGATSMRQPSGAETFMKTMLDPDQCKGSRHGL
jgi:hypothetical protein